MNMNQFLAIYKTRDKGTGSEVRETWGMEGECHILENVLKHSPECRQTFWGMSFLTFRVISPSIPGKWPQINFNSQFSISYEQNLQKHRCLFLSQKHNQYI